MFCNSFHIKILYVWHVEWQRVTEISVYCSIIDQCVLQYLIIYSITCNVIIFIVFCTVLPPMSWVQTVLYWRQLPVSLECSLFIKRRLYCVSYVSITHSWIVRAAGTHIPYAAASKWLTKWLVHLWSLSIQVWRCLSDCQGVLPIWKFIISVMLL